MTCPRKSGGEAQVEIETALKYKKSQGLELAISRQPWWKIIKYQSKSKLRWEFDESSAFTKARWRTPENLSEDKECKHSWHGVVI